MKVKKLENTLLIISSVSVLIAILAALFAFVSSEEHIVSTGFGMILVAFKTLFSFKFAEAPVLLVFVMFVISIACLVIWMVELIKKEAEGESWFKFGLSCVLMLCIIILGTMMFASNVTIDGKEMPLFNALRSIEHNGLARTLGVISVGLGYLGLMLTTLYAFLNLGMTIVVGPDYREVEVKVVRVENDEETEDAKETK